MAKREDYFQLAISESSGSESEVKDPFENKETEKKTSKKGVKKDGTESE